MIQSIFKVHFLTWQASVGSDDLHPVSRLANVDEVMVANNVNGAGKLAGRGLFGELLDGQGLKEEITI